MEGSRSISHPNTTTTYEILSRTKTKLIEGGIVHQVVCTRLFLSDWENLLIVSTGDGVSKRPNYVSEFLFQHATWFPSSKHSLPLPGEANISRHHDIINAKVIVRTIDMSTSGLGLLEKGLVGTEITASGTAVRGHAAAFKGKLRLTLLAE